MDVSMPAKGVGDRSVRTTSSATIRAIAAVSSPGAPRRPADRRRDGRAGNHGKRHPLVIAMRDQSVVASPSSDHGSTWPVRGGASAGRHRRRPGRRRPPPRNPEYRRAFGFGSGIDRASSGLPVDRARSTCSVADGDVRWRAATRRRRRPAPSRIAPRRRSIASDRKLGAIAGAGRVDATHRCLKMAARGSSAWTSSPSRRRQGAGRGSSPGFPAMPSRCKPWFRAADQATRRSRPCSRAITP